MQPIDPRIEEYLAGWLPASRGVVAEMEAYGRNQDFPLVGPLVGNLLAWLARSIDARSVFELGSGFGYSAWWFARGMRSDGRLFLTDRSPERLDRARRYLERDGLAERAEFLPGDALDHLRRHPGPFDIVFNDIDKESYPQAWEVAAERIRPGGLFVSDNMLWFGRVLDPGDDPTALGVRELTSRLYADPDWDTIVIPIRDGVSVSRRRTEAVGSIDQSPAGPTRSGRAGSSKSG